MKLTTIDLFAGAGGLTEGFRQAGYNCLLGNDFSEQACETFAHNHPESAVIAAPIESLDTKKIRLDLGLAKGDLDVLIGGPPCQGFSINAPERFLEDPRNSLFKHYLRFVDEFQPSSFVFENVPGMLSLGNGRIFDQIISEMESRGYQTNARILLAAHYGVPQVRWRMIILGSRLGDKLKHPDPTHFHLARPNFRGGSTHATRLLPLDSQNLIPAVTLRDAIADLPPVERGKGAEICSYPKSRKLSDFARELRDGSDKLYNHTANQLSEINLRRLEHIPPGGAWTDIPFDLLPAGMQKAKPGDHTKRYGRLKWDSVAGTMMTKCDPHWGAVFHPEQQRTFSVREAARIQSFPDRYQFLGSRGSQYEQVGNAVPVLMARAIATDLRKQITAALPSHAA